MTDIEEMIASPEPEEPFEEKIETPPVQEEPEPVQPDPMSLETAIGVVMQNRPELLQPAQPVQQPPQQPQGFPSWEEWEGTDLGQYIEERAKHATNQILGSHAEAQRRIESGLANVPAEYREIVRTEISGYGPQVYQDPNVAQEAITHAVGKAFLSGKIQPKSQGTVVRSAKPETSSFVKGSTPQANPLHSEYLESLAMFKLTPEHYPFEKWRKDRSEG